MKSLFLTTMFGRLAQSVLGPLLDPRCWGKFWEARGIRKVLVHGAKHAKDPAKYALDVMRFRTGHFGAIPYDAIHPEPKPPPKRQPARASRRAVPVAINCDKGDAERALRQSPTNVVPIRNERTAPSERSRRYDAANDWTGCL